MLRAEIQNLAKQVAPLPLLLTSQKIAAASVSESKKLTSSISQRGHIILIASEEKEPWLNFH